MAVSASDDLLATASAFLVALRVGEGYKEELLLPLCDALRACASEWKHSDSIPKSGAEVIVGMHCDILIGGDLYRGDEAEAIYTAAATIAGLIQDCLSSD